MKRYTTIITIAAVAVALAACSKSKEGDAAESTDKYKITHIPVQLDEDESWSMMDMSGNLLFADRFEECPSVVMNGLFSVKEDDGYNVYRASSNPTKVNGLEGLKDVGLLADGLMPVAFPGESIKLVDADGNVKFTLDSIAGKEVLYCDVNFYEGTLVVITTDGLKGVVDTSGRCIVKPKYDLITNFSDGLAMARRPISGEGSDKRFYIINKQGEEVCKLNKSIRAITGFINGRAYVRDYYGYAAEDGDAKALEYGDPIAYGWIYDTRDYRCGFVGTNGDVTYLPSWVKEVWDMLDDAFVVSQSDGEKIERNFGVISLDGETIIPTMYSKIIPLEGGKCFVVNDSKTSEWSIINRNNEELELLDINDAYFLDKDKFAAKIGSIWMIMDKDGEKVGNTTFCQTGGGMNYVYSDNIGTSQIVDSIVAQIGNNSLAGYEIGATPSEYVPERTYSYLHEQDFTPKNQPRGSYLCNFDVAVHFDADICKYGRSYNYEFNDNSHVDSVTLKAKLKIALPDDIIDDLEKALERKGFDKYGTFGGELVMLSRDMSTRISISKGYRPWKYGDYLNPDGLTIVMSIVYGWEQLPEIEDFDIVFDDGYGF